MEFLLLSLLTLPTRIYYFYYYFYYCEATILCSLSEPLLKSNIQNSVAQQAS